MTRCLAMLTLLVLPACAGQRDYEGGQSGQNDGGDEDCQPSLSAMESDDRSLGFSANDVMALLQNRLPLEVLWTEMTPGDASTDIALALTAAGPPERAEPGGDTLLCVEARPWMRIPVDMSMTLAGGEVIANGTTVVDVGALDLGRVHLSTVRNLPAEFSGEYATQLDSAFTEFSGSYEPGTVHFDGAWVVLHRTWAEPVVAIEYLYHTPVAGGSSTVWRGSWSLSR